MFLTVQYFFLTIIVVTHAFVVLPNQAIKRQNPAHFSILFDDFGGDILGDSSAATTPPQLRERLLDYKTTLVQKDSQIAKNWRMGNWKVRGFSLDKGGGGRGNSSKTDIHVSKVALGPVDTQSIVVGRTDGSIMLITLGTEYWTNFRATGGDDEMLQTGNEQEHKESYGETPFQITHQFMSGTSAITSLLVADTTDTTILISAGNDGIIRVWTYPEEDTKIVPLRTLKLHSGPIVALKSVEMDSKELLLSASRDGTMALWDLMTGDLVVTSHVNDSISCADAEGSQIFIGLETGQVLAYIVKDMVHAASVSDTFPKPIHIFKAHDAGAVTALCCAGEGSLRLSNPGTKSTVLLTGGVDGVIKQWEMIADDDSKKLQHWPRLANQGTKRRAHLFQGHAPGPITSLACMDQSTILSAGADGTVRAWSPSKGTEIFRMDGFTESLTSLCLVDELLITDGMEEFVCVHDFDVDDGEFKQGYELQW